MTNENLFIYAYCIDNISIYTLSTTGVNSRREQFVAYYIKHLFNHYTVYLHYLIGNNTKIAKTPTEILSKALVPEILEAGLATLADTSVAAAAGFAHAQAIRSTSGISDLASEAEQVAGDSALSDSGVLVGLRFIPIFYVD